MTSGLDKPEVDFLVLADHAEVVGGKLYMMGGGWDIRRIEDFTKPFNMNIAVGVLTPWALANKENKFQLIIEDEDGKKLGPTVDGSFTVGRPSNAIEGQNQKPCGVRRRRQVDHLGCRRKKSGGLRTSHPAQRDKHLTGPVSVPGESQRVPLLR